MTPNRGWFPNYEEYDGGKVFIGDDSHLKIVGHKRVNIRLIDEGLKGIDDVLQILMLTQNLLSLSKL